VPALTLPKGRVSLRKHAMHVGDLLSNGPAIGLEVEEEGPCNVEMRSTLGGCESGVRKFQGNQLWSFRLLPLMVLTNP
jgi:hypothetical protein